METTIDLSQRSVRRTPDAAELLSALLRRWPVLVIVPILATLATLGLYLTQPPTYRATATVVVPTASDGQATAPVFVAQAVSNFQGALRSTAVIRRTAAATGVPIADVAAGLAAEQRGTSQLVEVSYTGGDRAAASRVVEAASEQALQLVVGGGLAAAQHELDLAQQAYADAEQALSEFLAETGMLVPEQVFRKMDLRLIALRDELGHAQAAGADAEARRLQTLIDQRESELTAQVIDYQRLQVDRQRAITGLKNADGDYFAARAFVTTAQSGSAITTSPAIPASTRDELTRRLPAVIALALALAAILIVLLEVAAVARRPAGTRDGATTLRLPPEARGRLAPDEVGVSRT